MTPQERQWHWGEGNKYALECMKALLLLNGGGALALLTFFGSRTRSMTSTATEAIGNSLFSFGMGAIGGVFLFMFAYLAQLHYGNEGTEIPRRNKGAVWWHNAAYIAAFFAVAGFVGGIWFARQAIVVALAS